MARKKSTDELDQLASASRELEQKIAELEALPSQLELELLERESTIPPPDDLIDRDRHRRFEEQAARGEIRNERRAQGRSLVLMFLMLGALAAVISWVIELAGR
ncbi:hypothetical protein HNR46_003995 [Haloferula luteola]|uniref:Uncharacterized protein n=1 Tax=Haloferula luteola TaxID=595692 RepID=A0A840VE01_9BACT|nr:hypothetical protein [Haloferula luteola]MBB5353734.1 hypothetical protein [Haloferula luteola]